MRRQHPDSTAEQRLQEQALATLDAFRSRGLPAFMRRLSQWRGLSRDARVDFEDDALQELALDCLTHPEVVLELEERQRHERWFAIVSRLAYRLQVRDARREDPAGVDHQPARDTHDLVLADLDLPPADAELMHQLIRHGERLKNGRLSIDSTARALGVGRKTVRRLWSSVAEQLGFGVEYRALWQRRLGETMARLAIAALYRSGRLRTLHEPEPADTDTNLLRLRRARSALDGLPLSNEVRRALARIAGFDGQRLVDLSPSRILQLAVDVSPDDARLRFWVFEAAIAEADLVLAARQLLMAHRTWSDRTPVVLARARLLEARGRRHAARHLLDRAIERQGMREPLVASRTSLGWPKRSAPSARRIRSTSSSSQTG